MKLLRLLRPDPLLTLCLILAMSTLLYSNTLASQRTEQHATATTLLVLADDRQTGSSQQNNDSKTQEG
jgi:hypothetical protein